MEVCDAAQVSVSRLVEVLSTELAPRSVDWVDDVTSEPTRCEVLLCHTTPDGALLRVFHDGLEVSRREVDLSDVEGDSRIRTLAAIVAETLKVCRKLDLLTGIGATSAIAGSHVGAMPLRLRRSDRNKWMLLLSSFDVRAILS